MGYFDGMNFPSTINLLLYDENARSKKMGEDIIQIYCNDCCKKINHTVLASAEVKGAEGEVYWTDTYQTLICGCGNVTFRKQGWFSEHQDFSPNYEPVYNYTYYPPLLFRKQPIWIFQLDENLVGVLNEVYSALQHDLRYIAAVGIRTILDMLLVTQVGDSGNNKAKYRALLEGEHATEDQLEMIKAVIETGDAAAHRGYKPNRKDLNSAMDIAETIIERIYISGKREELLLEKALELKSKVPPRYTQA